MTLALFSPDRSASALWTILGAEAPHAGAAGRRPVPAAARHHRPARQLGRVCLTQGACPTSTSASGYASAAPTRASIQQWFDALRAGATRAWLRRLPGRAGPDRSPARVHRFHAMRPTRGACRSSTATRRCRLSETRRYRSLRRHAQLSALARRRPRVTISSTNASSAPTAPPSPPPSALLYVLLRHALLAGARDAARSTAARAFGAALFDVIDRDPLIANIGGAAARPAQATISQIDAARLGLAATADWRWPIGHSPARARCDGDEASRRAAPASQKRTMRSARSPICRRRGSSACSPSTSICARIGLTPGSRRSTRSAWQRAAPARDRAVSISARSAGSRTCGPRRREPPVPRPRGVAGGVARRRRADLFEDADQRRLRPRALARAGRDRGRAAERLPVACERRHEPTPFAVNLSSARMRAAHGAHRRRAQRPADRCAARLSDSSAACTRAIRASSSTAFIYVLRDRFPLLSGQLDRGAGGHDRGGRRGAQRRRRPRPARVHRRPDYPYGIDRPAGAGARPRRAAIADEIERLRDSLDAVSDLLLAESVHQAVQGNFARTQGVAAGADRARGAARARDHPHAAQRPRAHLPGRARARCGARRAGRRAVAARRANPQLNHWLAEHLPAPADIQWSVTRRQRGAAVCSRSPHSVSSRSTSC